MLIFTVEIVESGGRYFFLKITVSFEVTLIKAYIYIA